MTGSIDFAARVVLPEHVAARELDGELVLLNFDSERYFGLDEVGARILEVLRGSATIEAGIEALLEEFEVDAGQLRGDVEGLLGQLLDGGLVELQAS